MGGVDPALSYQATANPQYLYDAESALDAILEEQHARVCAGGVQTASVQYIKHLDFHLRKQFFFAALNQI